MIKIDEIKKAEIQKKIDEEANKLAKLKSAKEKLLALGLTEEEIKLTFGI